MKTKNVLLGLVFGAFVLFSCAKKSGDIYPDAKSDIEVVKNLNNNTVTRLIQAKLQSSEQSYEEIQALSKLFRQMSMVEYDVYLNELYQIALAQATSPELKAQVEVQLIEAKAKSEFIKQTFNKSINQLTSEEFDEFDRLYKSKKQCDQKANCPTKSFPNETSKGANSDARADNKSLVNAQGQNDCDYEFSVDNLNKGIRNTYPGSIEMDIILSLNGGRLNYRTEDRRSYFLIGKNRVDGLYPFGGSVYHFGVKLN